MLSVLRKKLGDKINTVFGRNSEKRSSMPVEITVLKRRTRISDPNAGVRSGLNSPEKKRP